MNTLPEPPLGFDYSDEKKREEFFLTHTFDTQDVLDKLKRRQERIEERRKRKMRDSDV